MKIGELSLAILIPKTDEIWKYSNPKQAQQNAFKYLGKYAYLFKSIRPEKKYMILNPATNRWVHFGQLGYEDHLHHNDAIRRYRYRKRASNIKGEWKDNPYSPNNLSINILW